MQRVVCTGPAVPVAYAWKDTADPTWRTSGRPVTGRRRALNPVKKFLIGLAVVLSAVVTVVLVGPGFIDWNAYRDQVKSEEHTSELQSLMRISYAVFCLKKKKNHI